MFEVVNHFFILVELNTLTHFRVFFKIVHEVFHVLLITMQFIWLILLLFATVMNILLAYCLHVQALDLPDSLFLPTANFRV